MVNVKYSLCDQFMFAFLCPEMQIDLWALKLVSFTALPHSAYVV